MYVGLLSACYDDPDTTRLGQVSQLLNQHFRFLTFIQSIQDYKRLRHVSDVRCKKRPYGIEFHGSVLARIFHCYLYLMAQWTATLWPFNDLQELIKKRSDNRRRGVFVFIRVFAKKIDQISLLPLIMIYQI